MLRFVLERVEQVGDGLYKAMLTPSDVRLLGAGKEGVSERSVIVVSESSFLRDQKRLEFKAGNAIPLSIGTKDIVLVVDSGVSNRLANPSSIVARQNNQDKSTGDTLFLNACSSLGGAKLGELAQRLLTTIRKHHPGRLEEGKARKWTNSPDNFFALTIQNRNKALNVNLRGRVGDHSCKLIQIKKDRPGYLRFILRDETQLPEAIETVLRSVEMRSKK